MSDLRHPRRPHSFLRTTFFALFLSGGIVVAAAYAFFSYSDSDLATYHSLMLEANPTLANKVERAPYTATQQQQNVRKDIYFSKGSDRLHFSLSSEDAHVILDHKHGNTALYEELNGVEVHAQHELRYVDESDRSVSDDNENAILKQKVCSGSAERVFLSYDARTFQAEKVYGCTYEAPGHRLDSLGDASSTARPEFELAAERASYDGKQLILERNVNLRHLLGSAASDLLVMRSLSEKSVDFDSFVFDDDVIFTVNNIGILACQKAEFDRTGRTGFFYGSSREPFVLLKVGLADDVRESDRSSMELKSRSMEIKASDDSREVSEAGISYLKADEEVTIDYPGKMCAYADQAIFRPNSSETRKLSGIVTLNTIDPTHSCIIVNPNGDRLEGSSIVIDTERRQMEVREPTGTMQTSASSLFSPKLSKEMLSPHDSIVQMKSDRLNWDFLNDILTLQGDAVIAHSDMGTFKCDNEIRIRYSERSGKNRVRSIESDGHTSIRRQDGNTGECRWLDCVGTMKLDHDKMEAVLQSYIDPSGKPANGKQVFYYDEFGEIQADKATILYGTVDKKSVVTKLTLEGNVYIVDHKGMKTSEGTGKPLRYALADYVEYSPTDNRMHLSSRGERRVLFYDTVNRLQMSAPALSLVRDPKTKKDAVKGHGDVRFHFIDTELERLLRKQTIEI